MYNGRERHLDNGIIYPIVSFIIKVLFHLNIVEYVKKLSVTLTMKCNRNRTEATLKKKVRRYRNIAIDLFILAKFIFLIVILLMGLSYMWMKIAVWYLLFSNVFTYFYYHLWCDDALLEKYQTVHRLRRRFVSLFTSVAFMLLCYSYLYLTMFPEHFSLIGTDNSVLAAILTSVEGSFAISVAKLESNSNIGTFVEISQMFNTFLFLTILLAKSLTKAEQL